MESRTHIVVVGGGFAGASFLRRLQPSLIHSARIWLIDRNEQYAYLPLIHEVATGRIHSEDVLSPIAPLCGGGRCKFINADVTDINLEERLIETDTGQLSYDYLVLTPGTTAALPPRQLREHFLLFRNLEDAIELRETLNRCWMTCRGKDHPGELAVAIVGGGTTGVELAFELSSLFRYLRRLYPFSQRHHPRIVLLEAGDRLMQWLDPYFHRIAIQRLKESGVEVYLNTLVREADADSVQAGEKSIPARIKIWAGGVTTSPLIKNLPVQHASLGRVHVDRHLTLPAHPEVYVLGDAAAYRDPGHGVLPPTAAVAVQQGSWAARDIKARRQGVPRKPFRYSYRGQVISMGPKGAIAEVPGAKFEGLAAQALYRGVLLYYLKNHRGRILTGADWIMDRALGRIGFGNPNHDPSQPGPLRDAGQ